MRNSFSLTGSNVFSIFLVLALLFSAPCAYGYGGGGGGGGGSDIMGNNPGDDPVDPLDSILTPPDFGDDPGSFSIDPMELDPIDPQSVGPMEPTIPELTEDEVLRIVIIGGYSGKIVLRIVTGEGVINAVMLAADVAALMKHTNALLTGEGLN